MFAKNHTIRFIRQGKIPKQDHEYAFIYEDDPSVIVFTKNPRLQKITPEKTSLILGHEKMHHVLQKNLGKDVSHKYDNLAQSFKAEQFLQGKLGKTVEIAELERLSFEELIQFAVQKAYEKNPYYYDEDTITAFLYWYNTYLFDFGGFESIEGSHGEPKLFVSYVFYTDMTKYQEVITKNVFEKRMKICVIRTTRPILTKIIDCIKEKNDAALQNSTNVSDEVKE